MSKRILLIQCHPDASHPHLCHALAYHLAFFAAINPLAYVFAALFLCGAAVFFWQGVVWGRMNFRITSGWHMWAAWGLILAGVIGVVLLIRSKPAATRLVAAS